MIIKVPAGWAVPESGATPEPAFFSRRKFLKTAALGSLIAGLPPVPAASEKPQWLRRPSADLNPAKRNTAFSLDRPVSAEGVVGRNNIFDEFSLDREKVWEIAADFVTTPWKIHVGGAVEKEAMIDVDNLARLLGLEERLYRHRCVETWAMAVPWSGIPLSKFVAWAKPLAKAKYLRMISYSSPERQPGWYASRRVFPYYESLTIAEATNDLAFLATGIYGHPLPPQHGAPIRLVVPWKYGLKSIKSILAFQFTVERPGTFWNDLSPGNYSWECNVDPSTIQPWSQAEETMIGTDETRKTLPFNGYAEFVKHLYA